MAAAGAGDFSAVGGVLGGAGGGGVADRRSGGVVVKAAPDYALRSRERCKPAECTGAAACWVALGTFDSMQRPITRAPRCGACGGVIRIRQWVPPQTDALQQARAS